MDTAQTIGVAAVGCIQAIAVALIYSARRSTRAVEAEVKNTHQTGLRDDLDGLREAVDRLALALDDSTRTTSTALGTLRQDVAIVRADQRGAFKDVAGLRDDISTLRSHQSLTARQVADLRAKLTTEGDTL